MHIPGDITVVTLLSIRWTKMYESQSTGLFHAAGRVLNPAFRDYDHRDILSDFENFLKLYYDDEATREAAYREWNDYQCVDFNGELFYHSNGEETQERAECSWAGEHRGTKGVDWWQYLKSAYRNKWPNLRELAIRVLSQTTSESAAERHFSAVEIVQPKTRASLSAESLKRRTFVRAEIQRSLANRTFNALLHTEDLERADATLDSDTAVFAQDLPEDSLED